VISNSGARILPRYRPGDGLHDTHLHETDCLIPWQQCAQVSSSRTLERFGETVKLPGPWRDEVAYVPHHRGDRQRHLWPASGLVLVRYRFRGRQLTMDWSTDVRAATAVAGSPSPPSCPNTGWVGGMEHRAFKCAYRPGDRHRLIFIGLHVRRAAVQRSSRTWTRERAKRPRTSASCEPLQTLSGFFSRHYCRRHARDSPWRSPERWGEYGSSCSSQGKHADADGDRCR